MSKIVIALGGNALQNGDDLSAESQQQVARNTAHKLTSLIEQGHDLVIVHGNGPQIGNLILQQEAGATRENPAMPLESSVAMTQGMMGYWLQQAFDEVAGDYGRQAVTIVTQIEVDAHDLAFKNPSKPIGPFYKTEAMAAEALSSKNASWKEDSGRGWRRVVPSPKPVKIIEKDIIKGVLDSKTIVIAAGGGGIAVTRDGRYFHGIEAVIDKDWSAARLAKDIDADILVILTAVDSVKVDFNTEKERSLGEITPQELKNQIVKNQFGEGSMLPKVEAAIDFSSSSKGRLTIITSLDNASRIWDRNVGTRVKM